MDLFTMMYHKRVNLLDTEVKAFDKSKILQVSSGSLSNTKLTVTSVSMLRRLETPATSSPDR